jgi:hypothetical protein
MLPLVITAVTGTVLVDDGAGAGAPVAALVGGNASYGVQRTSRSGVPLWRDDGCLEMLYDTTSVTPEIAEVLDRAFATWNTATAQCGGVAFSSYRAPNLPTTNDGLSTVHVRTDRWCRPATAAQPEQCYAPEASAVTRLIFIDDPTDPDDGKILEADMELDAVNFALLLPGQAAPVGSIAVDLQAVVTHEAGHVLGLAHDCGTGTEPWPMDHAGNLVPACTDAAPQVTAATMFFQINPGETGARTVEAGDTTGACILVRDLVCEPRIEAGCCAAPARGRRGGELVIAVGLGVGLLVRRRRKRRHGR